MKLSEGAASSAARVLGGSLGRHAGRPSLVASWLLSPVVLVGLAMTFTMVLATSLRQYCRDTNWGDPGQFTYSCYSDIPVLTSTKVLYEQWIPLLGGEGPEMQVGASSWLWLLARFNPDRTNLAPVFDAGVIVLTVAAVAAAIAIVSYTSPEQPWVGALFALSPVMVTSAVISLDVIGVAFALWALVAWKHGRALAAGFLCALAMLMNILWWLLPVVLLVDYIRRGDTPRIIGFSIMSLVPFGFVQAVWSVANPENFAASWDKALNIPAGYGGLWFVPSLAGATSNPDIVKWGWIAMSIGVLALVIGWMMSASYPVPPETAMAVLLSSFFLLAPANPVQHGVLLLPMLVLAVRDIRWIAPWFAAEALCATITWQYIYTSTEANKGAAAWFYGAIVVLRAVTLMVAAYRAWVVADEAGEDRVMSVATPSSTWGLAGQVR